MQNGYHSIILSFVVNNWSLHWCWLFVILKLLRPMMTHTKTLLLLLGIVTSTAYANSSDELSQTQFDRCLNGLRGQFVNQGISTNTFDRYRPSAPDPSVIAALNYQPEFKKDVWDYLSMLVDGERVADGLSAKARHGTNLGRIASHYGVDPHHLLGVWGVESNFGQTLGKKPLFDSLATLSCFDRRQSYFRQEFANALKIVQQGDIRPQDMTGSWAGAFGQTQFMPSTFLRLAVDFDQDGRKDIVQSVPDALASTANFLLKSGYRTGEVWGYEVKKPIGIRAVSDRKNKRPISHWRNLGYTLANGAPLPNTLSQAALLAPAGSNGPLFLVGKNFDAFYRYNNSENYALAIAHLSDLIAKGQSYDTDFVTAWPTDDAGISRKQARQIQQLLLQAGYDIGAVDGIIGDGTRRAIMAYQQTMGVPADGRAGQKLYRLMTSRSQQNSYSQQSHPQQYSQQSYPQQSVYQQQSTTPQRPSVYIVPANSNVAPQPVRPVLSQPSASTWQAPSVAVSGGVRHYRVTTDETGKKVLIPVYN